MILFIDDEPHYIETYVDELKLSGFEVTVCKDVDSAIAFVQGCLAKVDVCILDIMMPPGNAFKSDETQMGLRTGVRVYDRLRQQVPDVPIIVLTNISAGDIERKFVKDGNCRLLRKDQCLPFELAEQVRQVVTK